MNYLTLDRRYLARVVDMAEALADELPEVWADQRDGRAARRRRIQARTEFIMDSGVVIGADVGGVIVGIIALVVTEHPIVGLMMAGEACWYVDPMFRTGFIGRGLLAEAEKWARGRGCEMMQIGSPEGASAIYLKRQGYSAVETAFAKRL